MDSLIGKVNEAYALYRNGKRLETGSSSNRLVMDFLNKNDKANFIYTVRA